MTTDDNRNFCPTGISRVEKLKILENSLNSIIFMASMLICEAKKPQVCERKTSERERNSTLCREIIASNERT